MEVDINTDKAVDEKKVFTKERIGKLLIYYSLVSVPLLLTIIIHMGIKEDHKNWAVVNYVETVLIDQTETSNDYINARVISLEDKFDTKTNFLKEVEDYMIKKGNETKEIRNLVNSVREKRKESFLNN